MSSSLPTIEKTGGAAWQFSVNNAQFEIGATWETSRHMLRMVKDQFKAFVSNAWTVAGSSDGSTAGMDTVDRWSADDKLVWPGSTPTNPHSWIVLKQAGINANYHVLFELTDQQGYQNVTVYASPNAAFTGGSTTVRPTSTQEVLVRYNAPFVNVYMGMAAPYKWHMMQSGDGQCTRLIVCHAGAVIVFWAFEKVKSPHAYWTDACFQWVGNTGQFEPLYYGSQSLDAGCYQRGRTPYGVVDLRMTCETLLFKALGDTNLEYPFDLEEAWPIMPVGIVALTQGSRIRLGGLYDLYFGADGFIVGDTYPGDGTKVMVQFDNVVLPWDQLTVPQTA